MELVVSSPQGAWSLVKMMAWEVCWAKDDWIPMRSVFLGFVVFQWCNECCLCLDLWTKNHHHHCNSSFDAFYDLLCVIWCNVDGLAISQILLQWVANVYRNLRYFISRLVEKPVKRCHVNIPHIEAPRSQKVKRSPSAMVSWPSVDRWIYFWFLLGWLEYFGPLFVNMITAGGLFASFFARYYGCHGAFCQCFFRPWIFGRDFWQLCAAVDRRLPRAFGLLYGTFRTTSRAPGTVPLSERGGWMVHKTSKGSVDYI